MQLSNLLLILTPFLTPALGITVSYDTGYDDGSRSLGSVTCSDGPYGLITKGFTDQGSLPTFPFIGGAFTVTSYDSDSCGACYALTYAGKTINIIAVDRAAAGFNVAQEALDALTGGQAVKLGRIDANYTQVANSECGLSA